MASRAADPRQLSDLLELSQTLGATLNLGIETSAASRGKGTAMPSAA